MEVVDGIGVYAGEREAASLCSKACENQGSGYVQTHNGFLSAETPAVRMLAEKRWSCYNKKMTPQLQSRNVPAR